MHLSLPRLAFYQTSHLLLAGLPVVACGPQNSKQEIAFPPVHGYNCNTVSLIHGASTPAIR